MPNFSLAHREPELGSSGSEWRRVCTETQIDNIADVTSLEAGEPGRTQPIEFEMR